MTQDEVTELLDSDAPLRERTLWRMLYESAARAEKILTLDIEDLDTVNRCASVVRKGGARDVIYWQTGTARLLPRLTGGRKAEALGRWQAETDPASRRRR
jgi:integrase